MTDPATVAAFDQAQAAVSSEPDNLVGALESAHATCGCGGPVDAMGHLIYFAQLYRKEFSADELAALLIQAVARLVISKEAR